MDVNKTHVEYVTKRALELSSALGYLRGALIGEILYSNITSKQFNHMYETLQRSYKLGGDYMDEYDTSRIQNRAKELGITL